MLTFLARSTAECGLTIRLMVFLGDSRSSRGLSACGFGADRVTAMPDSSAVIPTMAMPGAMARTQSLMVCRA